MVLIIEPLTPEKLAYLKDKDYLLVNSICKINKNVIYELYLINDTVSDIGIINNTLVLFDELLLTLKINGVYIKNMNMDNIKKYTNYYGVEVYSL
ncbi:MAG: hypothetical protein IKC22_04105 [Bacilli bacterium]|nr:hypothetical protein [Bacilli bacterium]